MSEFFKAVNESLSMADVARHFGYTPNRSGFIKSPFKEERTASCKLYPRSFYDFSSGTGGDIIRFASAVLGLNNWEACRYLIEAFSLPFSLSGSSDNREQIQQRQQERQKQQEKEKQESCQNVFPEAASFEEVTMSDAEQAELTAALIGHGFEAQTIDELLLAKDA